MRQVNRVDANGFYIEPIVLDDGEVLTEAVTVTNDDGTTSTTYQPRSDIITVPVPEGFHHPRWVNGEWMEGKTDAELLEIAINAKLAELEASYDQATALVQSSALGTPHTYVVRSGGNDYSAFFNAKFALVLSTFYNGNPFNWFTIEAGDVLHTKDQFCQVYVDIETFTETARGQRKTYQTNIAGCQSITELNNITITF